MQQNTLAPAEITTPTHRWRSPKALVEILNRGAASPTLSEHALRHHLRHATENGLAPYVRRLGRKILVSEQGFLDWLDRQG